MGAREGRLEVARRENPECAGHAFDPRFIPRKRIGGDDRDAVLGRRVIGEIDRDVFVGQRSAGERMLSNQVMKVRMAAREKVSGIRE